MKTINADCMLTVDYVVMALLPPSFCT